ncbi:integrase [Bacillus thuringiensis serovar mexicanensis]|uniref:Integrase n=1 Tax=Bacillus thuringiensis serovar mexicanensis TaxID=180868 RepID=A0A242W2B8_BACTU|nr:DNA integration/recombination/inversion protein [Bacillus thuringiensis serovar monterrey BGSC 4AJ1]OTW44704.1 integrase [Bacillus thuringiensis serovar mexicanensis]OTW97056.1 integrase [Bacillus thuringiensis serovar monterrey]
MQQNLQIHNYVLIVLILIEETHSKWKSGEITAVMFMKILELKKNTFYKIMKEYEEEK